MFRNLLRDRLRVAGTAPRSAHLREKCDVIEKITFNASVQRVRRTHAADSDAPRHVFVSVYNWLGETTIVVFDALADAIAVETIRPSQITERVQTMCESRCAHLAHISPEDDERLAARWRTFRILGRWFGDDVSASIEGGVANAQGNMTFDSYIRTSRRVLASIANEHTGLMRRVRCGDVRPSEVGTLSHRAMWPERWSAREMQLGHNIVVIQGAVHTAPSMLQCRACRKYTVSYYQMQTRSADEPMTVFCECNECGKRWKM